MSSRALRRLENKTIEEELAEINGNLAPETGTETAVKGKKKQSKKKKKKKPQNTFAALLGDDGESSSDDNDEDREDEQAAESQVEKKTSDQPKDTEKFVDAYQEITTPKKSKKKRNRKGKKKKKSTKVDDMNTDELDKILSEVRISDIKSGRKVKPTDADENADVIQIKISSPIYTPGGRLLTDQMFESCRHLIAPDKRYLDPDREYQGLFGKLSNAAIQDADSTASSFVTPEILSQIKKMSRRVRGWGGRDHRSIPGTTRKLVMTKIRDDWLPTSRRPLIMEEMTRRERKQLLEMKYPDDFKDAIENQLDEDNESDIHYFKITEGPLFSRLLTTEFFVSVAIEPDHESVIQLLQKAPYHLESILQVASILQRQGDNSNTNGLIERALFIFDWSLKNTFSLSSGNCRLPFEFYLNRQIYLTIFRYITVLTKKSTFYTALNYCKLLLSFDPADDPYGVRYFIDFYAFMAEEFQFLIDFYHSPLIQCYQAWKTPAISFTTAFCYWKLGKIDDAKSQLAAAVKSHPYTASMILSKMEGIDVPTSWPSNAAVSTSVEVATAIYTVRIGSLLSEPKLRTFVREELESNLDKSNISELLKEKSYYLNQQEDVPKNLLRHVVLSNETSAMAKIPPSFWDQNEIYEFDVLPPAQGTKIYDYIDQNKVADAVIDKTRQMADDEQIQQLIRQADQARQNRHGA